MAPVVLPAAEQGKERKLTALQRAEAAIAKVESAAKTPAPATVADKPAETQAADAKPADAAADKKPDEPAKDEAAEAAAKAEAEKKAAAEKAVKDEPRLSRAMALVAERERAVAKREKELTGKLDADRRAFEAEKASHAQSVTVDKADLDFVRTVRKTISEQGKAAAARLFGFTMEELVDAKSREVEPRAEDIIAQAQAQARAEAERRFNELMAAQKSEAEKAAAEAAEKAKADKTVEATEFVMRAVEVHNAEPAKRPWLSATPVSGEQLWSLAESMREQLGRKATQAEVLDRAEELLRARYAPLVGAQVTPSAPPPAPAPVAVAPKPEPPKQPQPQPAEQPRRRYERRASPLERAAKVLRDRGLT